MAYAAVPPALLTGRCGRP